MNIDFNVNCVRADPQGGLCELISGGGGGGSSTCDCDQGTYTPNVVIPTVNPNAFTGAAGNALGFWSRVNNRYEVTTICSVEHNTTFLLQAVGNLQISLPVLPVGAMPPIGLANWSGTSGADYVVPGIVFPQGAPPFAVADVTVKPFPSGTATGNLIANFTYEA